METITSIPNYNLLYGHQLERLIVRFFGDDNEIREKEYSLIRRLSNGQIEVLDQDGKTTIDPKSEKIKEIFTFKQHCWDFT